MAKKSFRQWYRNNTTIKEEKGYLKVVIAITCAALVVATIAGVNDINQNKQLYGLETAMLTTEDQMATYNADVRRYFSDYLQSDQMKQDILTSSQINEKLYDALLAEGLVPGLSSEQVDELVGMSVEAVTSSNGIDNINASAYSTLYTTVYKNVQDTVRKNMLSNNKIVVEQTVEYDIDAIVSQVESRVNAQNKTTTTKNIERENVKAVVEETLDGLKVTSNDKEKLKTSCINEVYKYLQEKFPDAGLQGEDGKDGIDGEDGYTPVLGTDYMTEDEWTEFVKETSSLLVDYILEVKDSDPDLWRTWNIQSLAGFSMTDNVLVRSMSKGKGNIKTLTFNWDRGDGEKTETEVILPNIKSVQKIEYFATKPINSRSVSIDSEVQDIVGNTDNGFIRVTYSTGATESIDITSLAGVFAQTYLNELIASMTDFVYGFSGGDTYYKLPSLELKDDGTWHCTLAVNKDGTTSIEYECDLFIGQDGKYHDSHGFIYETISYQNGGNEVTYPYATVQWYCSKHDSPIVKQIDAEGNAVLDENGKEVWACEDGGEKFVPITFGSLAADVNKLYETVQSVMDATLQNGETINVQLRDENGDPVFDEDGNPVYEQETDADGNPVVDADGNPVYKTETVQPDTVDDSVSEIKKQMLARYTFLLRQLDTDTFLSDAAPRDSEFKIYDSVMQNIGGLNNYNIFDKNNSTVTGHGYGKIRDIDQLIRDCADNDVSVLKYAMIEAGFVDIDEDTGLLEWNGSSVDLQLRNAFDSQIIELLSDFYVQYYSSETIDAATQNNVVKDIAALSETFTAYEEIMTCYRDGFATITLTDGTFSTSVDTINGYPQYVSDYYGLTTNSSSYNVGGTEYGTLSSDNKDNPYITQYSDRNGSSPIQTTSSTEKDDRLFEKKPVVKVATLSEAQAKYLYYNTQGDISARPLSVEYLNDTVDIENIGLMAAVTNPVIVPVFSGNESYDNITGAEIYVQYNDYAVQDGSSIKLGLTW